MSVIGPVVGLIALMATVGIHLDNKIGSVQTKLGKIDAAVKVLGDNQKNPTKQLVHDLLEAAKGRPFQPPLPKQSR
jgi:hypothetical protein